MLSRSVMSDCLQPDGLYSTRLLCPWNLPGMNTGVGCQYCLLQENLPDPGVKPESLVSPALAGGFFTTVTWEAPWSRVGFQKYSFS